MGIDAGATLCKIACIRDATLVTRSLPTGDLEAARHYIVACAPARIVATGGGARALEACLERPIARIDEFTAWLRGAPVLAADEAVALPARYLLVSLGTGTSILLAEGENARRVGGTALGGGTLMGLGQLLLGSEAFEELAKVALRGDRRRVDLLVGDIYPQGAPLPPDLNASSFAKLASRAPEDLAHALMGMIGENVGLLCASFAHTHAVDTVLYCGSTLHANPALRDVLRTLGKRLGLRALFLERGAFVGAVGAAVTDDPRSDGPAG